MPNLADDVAAQVQVIRPKAGDLIIVTIDKDEFNKDLSTRDVFDREIEDISQRYQGATFLVLPKGITVQHLPESVAKSVLARITGKR